LFNLPNLGPLFHNGAARTLAEAVDFYNSSEFGTSPVNLDFISTGVGVVGMEAITSFLESLVARPYALERSPVRFGTQLTDAGPTAAVTIPLTNSGSTALRFAAIPCRLEGPQASEFTIVSCALESPLAAGERRTIQVAFDPRSDGLKSAILELYPLGAAPSGVDLFGAGGPLGPPPRITAISARAGSVRAGEAITIDGSGFIAGATVRMGGVDGAYIRVLTPASISLRTPPHASGTVDIEVVNPDGQTTRLDSAYTYR
jgi:hypothetical protein